MVLRFFSPLFQILLHQQAGFMVNGIEIQQNGNRHIEHSGKH